MLVDSSVIINLAKIGKLELLREFGEIKISDDIYRETVSEGMGKTGTSVIKQACENWIDVVEFKGKARAKALAETEGIDEADASLILLAEELGEPIASNDFALMIVARSRGVETFWLTTLVLKAIKKKAITKTESKRMLLDLVKVGMTLRPEVYAAILQKIDAL